MNDSFKLFLLISAVICVFPACEKQERPMPGPVAGADPVDSLAVTNPQDSLLKAPPIFFNTDGKILHAVCYGPFRDGQAPGSILSKQQIKEDLMIISQHWHAIRLYTTDNNAEKILEVISENAIDLKVMLGIWISGKTPAANAVQVADAISCAKKYKGIVQAISCGNEIFGLPGSDIFVSSKDEIIGYINEIHDQAGVPATIDEIFFVWLNPNYAELVDLQDFLAIHVYGQWSNQSLENTIPYIDHVYKQLKVQFPEKPILITETGWTTSKSDWQFSSRADEESQKQFYTDCQQWSILNDVPIFYFEAFDERWKGETDHEAETNWGFYHANRTPKLLFDEGD